MHQRLISSLLILAIFVYPQIPSFANNPNSHFTVVKPKPQPTELAEIYDYFADQPNQPLSNLLLAGKKQYFIQEASYLDDSTSINNLARNMYRQWIYLELYKIMKFEYLMVNLYKTLPFVTNGDLNQTLKLFDEIIPYRQAAKYPQLALKRQKIRHELQLLLKDKAKYEDTKNYFLGRIESAYISLAYIEKRKQVFRNRYSTSDPRYKREIRKLEKLSQVIFHSSGLLTTKSFNRLVKPYYINETRQTLKIRESAVRQYMQELKEFLAKNKKDADIMEFINSGALVRLGKRLAFMATNTEQSQLRRRINQAFYQGVREIYSNLKLTADRANKKLFTNDIAAKIVSANVYTKRNNRTFHQLLIEIFREQPLHWVLIEDHPFLKPAVDDLTNFVNAELRTQSFRSLINYSIATGLLAISPLGTANNKFSKWLGRRLFLGLRAGVILGQGYVVSRFAYDAFLEYNNWRNIKRLTRLSLDTNGLTNLIQEENAYWSLIIQSGVTGVTALFNLATLRGYLVGKSATKSRIGPVRLAAAATWKGKAIPMSNWNRRISTSLKQLTQAARNLEVRGSYRQLKALSGNIAAVLTQMIVMVPASLPGSVKYFVSSIPKQIYQGVTLGTVMGIMGVTVQTYITALGLKSFVWAFETLGFTPPAYWQQSTINAVDRTKRDAMISTQEHLSVTKAEIARSAGFITMWEKMLERDQLTSEQRSRLQSAIAGANQTIRNFLKLELARWYFYFEYRSIMNSVFSSMGFGLTVAPNAEDPQTMTLYVAVGSTVYSVTVTAQEMMRVRDRVVMPLNPSAKKDMNSRHLHGAH